MLKTLSSVSKVQSSPRCPYPPSYMSNGTAFGGFLSSGAKANLAFGSINLRINHAEVTRSTPGRGRVTHTRFRYSAGVTLPISGVSDFVFEVCMAFKARSTCSRSGLPKKSMDTMSWKRCLRRVIRDDRFEDVGDFRRSL